MMTEEDLFTIRDACVRVIENETGAEWGERDGFRVDTRRGLHAIHMLQGVDIALQLIGAEDEDDGDEVHVC